MSYQVKYKKFPSSPDWLSFIKVFCRNFISNCRFAYSYYKYVKYDRLADFWAPDSSKDEVQWLIQGWARYIKRNSLMQFIDMQVFYTGWVPYPAKRMFQRFIQTGSFNKEHTPLWFQHPELAKGELGNV